MDEVTSNEKEFDENMTAQTDEPVRVKGKPKSEEWKQKHSEAMKLAHARRKAEKLGVEVV